MRNAAVAVAIPSHQDVNPFRALAGSVQNLGMLVYDFMYGSAERCQITYVFAIAMCVLGLAMEAAQDAVAMSHCSVTSI